MRFTIFTHVEHIKKDDLYFGYGPYIKEMNIWARHVDELEVVAPIVNREINAIYVSYEHKRLNFSQILAFDVTSIRNVLLSFWAIPKNIVTIFSAMKRADHIHLRCPGNIGLLAAVIQILFPKKPKTAKYAGNWDPKAEQPWSYKLQRWLLGNTFLTRNIQVLVYGEWENQTKNIKSFFTATYLESEKKEPELRDLKGTIRFLFVGTLSPGKQPLYVVKLIEMLSQRITLTLEIFGDGALKNELATYIQEKNIGSFIRLRGNCSAEVIQNEYKMSHFLMLPSKSEGWPKVVAEAMFWGCVPVVTKVSCTPSMLDHGRRGVFLEENLYEDIDEIISLLSDSGAYLRMSYEGMKWSRIYTLDFFESEIKQLLNKKT